MYKNQWLTSPGHPKICVVLCKFLKILMVSDKTAHKSLNIKKKKFPSFQWFCNKERKLKFKAQR